jgi:hypothetical protein
MAMSPEGMATDIFTEMETGYEGMSGGRVEMMKYLNAITSGLIKHIQENAEVLADSSGKLKVN